MMNNQLISILILLVLGYIIYNLTSPSKVKNAGEVKETPVVKDQEVTITADVSNTPTVTEGQTEGTDKVNDFQPNDPSESSGADLNAAFQPPIPLGTDTNAIDFNKNNVDKYDSKDYLPKEINDEWFETDFTGAKYNINDDNLINTERYVIGINTVGQANKNASYDLRGTIPNPKFTVSPWNNSTYEPDHNLRPLC